jgi:hypothetical protein
MKRVMPPYPPLVSLPEACGIAGLSRSVGYEWANAGQFPGAVHMNGRWYVRTTLLLRWLHGPEGVASGGVSGVESIARPTGAGVPAASLPVPGRGFIPDSDGEGSR